MWLSASRYCYNKAIDWLKNNRDIKSAYSLRNRVMNSDLPDWVKSCPNHPRENAIMDAYDAYWQALKNKGKAAFRNCRQPSQSLKFHKVNYKNSCWYPGLTRNLTFKASEPIPTNCDWGTQLVRNRGRWFAIFPTFKPVETNQQSKVIALDPGVRTFLTGYDSQNVLEFGEGDIKRIYKLCFHLDKLISKMSNAPKRQRRRMKKACERMRVKIRNLIDECHRQTANYLTRHYALIFLPTFETSNMVGRIKRRINSKTVRNMLNWAHYRFKVFLKQKAVSRGVIVVDSNESYSSKTCSSCGYVHPKLGGSKVFKCPQCHQEVLRDVNGARGVMLRALRDGSFALSVTAQGIAIASSVFVQSC